MAVAGVISGVLELMVQFHLLLWDFKVLHGRLTRGKLLNAARMCCFLGGVAARHIDKLSPWCIGGVDLAQF